MGGEGGGGREEEVEVFREARYPQKHIVVADLRAAEFQSVSAFRSDAGTLAM